MTTKLGIPPHLGPERAYLAFFGNWALFIVFISINRTQVYLICIFHSVQTHTSKFLLIFAHLTANTSQIRWPRALKRAYEAKNGRKQPILGWGCLPYCGLNFCLQPLLDFLRRLRTDACPTNLSDAPGYPEKCTKP